MVTRRDETEVPEDVEIRATPREPVQDPTLGIDVAIARQGRPRHRLVSIGDSLTHGFQSGAVFNTSLSYSAIIAHELGGTALRYPLYGGPGGLPVNIELILRELHRRFGPQLSWWEVPLAVFDVQQLMDRIEDYWERGPGAVAPVTATINHVLAVYGWDLRDALERTAERAHAEIATPQDDLVQQLVQNNGARAALRVLPNATADDRTLTVFDAAARLGADTDGDGADSEHGIEALVVNLGANNALGVVTELRVAWSGPGFDSLDGKSGYTVWRPSHFISELAKVGKQVERIAARHVIWCTIPHVTIAPIARGVGAKQSPGSRYFPYYTRPWIADQDFDPSQDPHITGAQARAVDSAIDQYNDAIAHTVARARRDGRDWRLLDLAGILDRLAGRRYVQDPNARPSWWQPYPLPPELAALRPVPDTSFLLTDEDGRRSAGGLFSLDGVHPTTVGYGIVAQELINVMVGAGVEFTAPDGTVRPAPIRVDFTRLIGRDTLLTAPPANITSGLGVVAWADETFDLLRRALPF